MYISKNKIDYISKYPENYKNIKIQKQEIIKKDYSEKKLKIFI